MKHNLEVEWYRHTLEIGSYTMDDAAPLVIEDSMPEACRAEATNTQEPERLYQVLLLVWLVCIPDSCSTRMFQSA